MNSRILILGAGISGLSAAWFLEKRGFKDIIILEASQKIGGKVSTIHEDGFLIESAADSFITAKPHALQLIEELGLENEVIEPLTKRFLIFKNGIMHESPKGLRMLTPTDVKSFRQSTLFSGAGIDRILQEKNVPAKKDDEDESFASFITRRFGIEMLQNYAEPLFGGIYATPVEQLSMKAAFPQLLELEKKFGSLAAAAEVSLSNHLPERPAFVSLKKGMGSLVSSLNEKLKYTTIQSGANAVAVLRGKNGYLVTADDGRIFDSKAIISALPAPVFADLMRDHSKSEMVLDSFTTATSRIVTFAFEKFQIRADMNATGFVVAKSEGSGLTACTWTSEKWPGRAPEGYALVRCFLSNTEAVDTPSLRDFALVELSDVLGISGTPYKAWINEWRNSLPQYKVGHMEKVRLLNNWVSEKPNFAITGAYLDGVGLPDCIRLSEEAAEKMSASFNS